MSNTKIRSALESCIEELCVRCREAAAAHGNPLPCINGCETVRKAKAALAAPDEVVVSQNATTTRVNIVAMREALKSAKHYLDGYSVHVLEFRRKVDAALAALPNND